MKATSPSDKRPKCDLAGRSSIMVLIGGPERGAGRASPVSQSG